LIGSGSGRSSIMPSSFETFQKKKRKRSRSRDDTRRPTNPFLDPSPTTNSREEELLDHILLFTSSPDECDENIEFLLNYLQKNDCGAGTIRITLKEIAYMLLSWVIDNVKRNEVDSISAKALLVCLSVLSKDEAQRILTQSVLFKLLPNMTEGDCRVYEQLLDLFHPTMDVACKSILLPLVQNGTKSDAKILEATLRWIHSIHLSRKGNPKTTFQLIAGNADVILAFCKVLMLGGDGAHIIVAKTILSDALFNTRHHMDGFATLLLKNSGDHFRSGKTESADNETGTSGKMTISTAATTFRSYHEDLFQTIDAFFEKNVDPLSEAMVVEIDSDSQLIVVKALPTMLECFFAQSREWDSHENKTKNRKQKDRLATLQFTLFIRWAELLITSPSTAESLGSLRQMLQIVLDFDSYVPQQQKEQDDDSSSYKYLKKIALFLLETQCSARAQYDAIEGLRTLLQLNYQLLQERMADAIMISCRHLQSGTRFLLTMVDSYRMLRQQRFIFAFVLGAMNNLSQRDDDDSLSVLCQSATDGTFSTVLASAIRSTPQLEIQEIFKMVREVMDTLFKNEVEYSSKTLTTVLAIIQHLVSVTLESVRVESSTARSIAKICIDLITCLVQGMDVKTSAKFQGFSMTLSGRILGLHDRCVFWLGQGEELELPPVMKAAIRNSQNQHGQEDDRLDGILLLSCHRLRQLNSLIILRYHREINNLSEENGSAELEVEAHRLAYFIGEAVSGTSVVDPNRAEREILLARNFNPWVDYADPIHLDSFLTWVMSKALPQVSLDCALVKESSPSARVATSLLSDSSFFEHQEIASRLAIVSLLTARKNLLEILTDCCSASNEITQLISFLESSHEKIKPSFAAGKTIQNICVENVEYATTLVECALRSVLIVNGTPWKAASDEIWTYLLALSLALQHACRDLCLSDSECLRTRSLHLFHALRHFVVELILGRPQATRNYFDGANPLPTVFDIVGTDLKMLSICSATGNNIPAVLLTTAVTLCESILTTAMASLNIDTSSANHLKTGIALLAKRSRSRFELRTLISFSRYLLEGLRFTKWTLICNGDGGSELSEHLSEVIRLLHDIVLQEFRFDDPENQDKSKLEISLDDDSFVDGYLLLGDLLRSGCMSLIPGHRIETFHNGLVLTCTKALIRVSHESTNEIVSNAVCYLATCTTYFKPTSSLSSTIVDALLAPTTRNLDRELLEASFCASIAALDDAFLRSFLGNATESQESSSIACKLRLINLVLRYATTDTQTQILSEFGWNLFLVALEPLAYPSSDGEPSRAEEVADACSLLDDLLKRRDVYTFRERDLALLLSYLVSVLGPANRSGQTSLHDVTAVYKHVTVLFSTMFNRYSKQLYAVVPSVISTLHCLLRHILGAPCALEDNDVVERGKCFSRTCELLVSHRDVYRKHLVGIILDFVAGLKGALELVRRDSLLPAIYNLLDTMTNYEMQQLNANMDTQGKALFRTIHQAYSKMHAYKGQ
jgi:Urb2/Npa2 family